MYTSEHYAHEYDIDVDIDMRCAVDIVFIRTWFPVEVPRFYSVVTSLMQPLADKQRWQGLRTDAQLRNELGIRRAPQEDSLYRVRWRALPIATR